MTLDFMSSEESANGSDSDDDKFMEKPILWRSEKFTDHDFSRTSLILLHSAERASIVLRGLQQRGKLLFESIEIVCGCCTVQSTLSLSSQLLEYQLN